LKDLEDQLEEVGEKKKRLSDQVLRVQVGREESSERTELLSRLEEKRLLKSRLSKELEEFKSCDPQHLTQLRESCDHTLILHNPVIQFQDNQGPWLQ